MGSTQGDDFTLDDMFITASATKGTMRNEEKRIKDKAVAGHILLLLNEGFLGRVA